MLKFLVVFILLASCLPAPAQNKDGLVAYYSFNKGNAHNEMGASAKAIGVSYCEDRFGNPRSACLLHGNNQSYLNLGTDRILKPQAGSISLWLKMNAEIYSGLGARWNPIILTKNANGDDYFEAYSLAYDLQVKKLSASSTYKTNEINARSVNRLTLNEWHHAVITYNDDSLCLYLDGALQSCVNKNFSTEFLAGDSVMIGNSANTKNNRYLDAAIDDVRIYNKVLSPENVSDLYNEADPNRIHHLLKLFFIIIILLVLLYGIIALITNKYKRELQREKEKNRLLSQMYEMETKVIKAQMNPHFIFNSMNSIQQFILSNDVKQANTYLVKFSRLLRKILESNTDENISLVDEIDILNKYIEMEALRFRNAFSFELITDERLLHSGIRIPQMLIQPFIENAVWHGLLPKDGEKILTVKFQFIDQKLLSCIIDDNGVGRSTIKATQTVTKEKSLGIYFIKQRLALMQKQGDKTYGVEIIDKVSGTGQVEGTSVIIRMPFFT
ncbi:hypothetical protein BH11BAC7_BH11BAC7_22700 [soil metagenome]